MGNWICFKLIVLNEILIMKKIIYIILLFFLYSCDNALFNEGSTITKNIEISDFNEIHVNDIFEINLIQDTVCKIEVTAGANLIPNLEFIVDKDKKLSINDNNSARWSRDYDKIELNIYVDILWRLRLNSSAKIVSLNTLATPDLKILSITDYSEININLNCDNCYIVNSGTSGGEISIEGSTNSLTIFSRGSYRINAENFAANYVYVTNESIANCSVHAVKELHIEILRSGYIYYKGDPYKIEYLNEKAKEQLIKLD
jgi:Putative auto-transporter adhesin, head GIN domain